MRSEMNGAKGAATVTATDGGLRATASFAIPEALTSITIKHEGKNTALSSLRVAGGSTTELTATGWAPATVLNFLYRLEEKGWVKGGKAGSQNTYLPTVTRRAYCVAAMRQRMDTLFGGSLPEAVRALASESGASQSQLEQAIRVLEEQHQEAEEYDLYDPYG